MREKVICGRLQRLLGVFGDDARVQTISNHVRAVSGGEMGNVRGLVGLLWRLNHLGRSAGGGRRNLQRGHLVRKCAGKMQYYGDVLCIGWRGQPIPELTVGNEDHTPTLWVFTVASKVAAGGRGRALPCAIRLGWWGWPDESGTNSLII